MHDLMNISVSSIHEEDTEDLIKTCYDAENETSNNMASTPSQRYELRLNRTSLDLQHIVTGPDFMCDSNSDSDSSIKFNQTLSQTSTQKKFCLLLGRFRIQQNTIFNESTLSLIIRSATFTK